MSPVHRTRDRETTRSKIVAAARAEFAERGYSGARMEQIAERARINKELIYHYFRGKEHLFEEVRSRQLADAEAGNAVTPNPLVDRSQKLSELFAWRFQRMLGDLEWIKLLTWEAVQTDIGPPPNEDARRATIKEAVAAIKKAQNEGLVPADFDPRLLQLAVFALATYPLAFPQITSMTTGMSVSDKRFHAAWNSFLRQLGAQLLSAAGPRAAPTRAATNHPNKKSTKKPVRRTRTDVRKT
jgi:AcrR family transcriptional regulator